MKNSKSVGIALVVMMLLALTCGAHLAWGQEVTAAITGRVTDPSGAAIAGASVTARDVARDVSYPTETNADGVYYLTRLQIGRYEIKIEAKGFRTALRPAFELVLNQVARVDVQLVVGTVSERYSSTANRDH
jgi:Carboxypeptidase regulatory-like domain